MTIVGLTGGIGMGKSTVADMIRRHGIPVWDADGAVHTIYDTDLIFRDHLRRHFPSVWSGESVDRRALGDIVFSDPDKNFLLRLLLGKAITTSLSEFHREFEKSAVRVLDVPLLFEQGLDRDCDFTIVVTCPPEVQRERVLARPDMTPERLERILSHQMKVGAREARGTYVIDTNTDFEYVEDQLFSIFAPSMDWS